MSRVSNHMGILNYKDNRVEMSAAKSIINNPPINNPPQPMPDRFFSPIPDNRDFILAQIRRDQELQFELRRTMLPDRR